MTEYTKLTLSINEIKNKIVYNIILMVCRRNKLDETHTNTIFKKIKDIDKKTIIDFQVNNNKYSINIINAKLNTITSNSILDEYMNKNIHIKKFIIIKSPSKRVIKQIVKNYKNCEYFGFHELINDILKVFYISKHILLDENEKLLLLEKLETNKLSKIYDTDMMSRYYNAKINDIFRIIRNNITSGYEVAHRTVVQGKIDLMYVE